MANVKITELTALTAADSASTDVLPIVDVSADATKKLAISDLHRSVPDGTLSAPGIAFQSDLNSGLYRSGTDAIALVTNGAARISIDATGNVTIPNNLTVEGTTTFIDSQTLRIEDKNIELGVVSTPTNTTADGGGITLKGATDKTITWVNSTGAWTFNQPVNMTGGNVGIGTTAPTETLTLNTATGASIGFEYGGTEIATINNNNAALYVHAGSGKLLSLGAGGSERMRVASDGTVGIGCVPSSFQSGFDALQIGGNLVLNVDSTGVGAGVYMSNNVYRDSGNSRWEYINTDEASQYYQANGEHVWRSAASGSANAAITWSESMRIDSSGNVGIGTTNIQKKLHVRKDGDSYPMLVQNRANASSTCGIVLIAAGVDFSDNRYASIEAVSGGVGNTLHHLAFRTCTNGVTPQERMRIDSSGNVGIGTTPNSDSQLHVKSGANDNNPILRLEGATNNFLNFRQTGSVYDINVTASDPLSFTIGATERMRIDSSGNVGIGTTSPAKSLEIFRDSFPCLMLNDGGQYKSYMQLGGNDLEIRGSSGAMEFYTGSADGLSSTERMRIDSSGRLLVGLPTTADSNAQLQVSSTNFGVAQLFRTGSAGASLHISSTTGTLASPNALSDGDHAGYVSFRAYDGATWRTGANIGAAADGQAWASGDCPGRLVFSTTADGESSPTERMRITSDGKFGFNTTNPGAFDSGANNFVVLGNTSGTGHAGITIASGNDSYGNIYFGDGTGAASYKGFIAYNHNGDTLRFGSAGTERMRIESGGASKFSGTIAPSADNTHNVGGSSLRWSAIYAVNGTIQTSDQREKTNVLDSSLGFDFVKSLRPVSYKWINGGQVETGVNNKGELQYTSNAGQRTHWGFIAQEVKQSIDDAGVDFGGWVLTDKDDPSSQQALRYDQFIAPLTKALQEAIAKIETLEQRLSDAGIA
jgi:hypothetical protein